MKCDDGIPRSAVRTTASRKCGVWLSISSALSVWPASAQLSPPSRWPSWALVFRPLIQEPVSRLWYGAMNSGKPFFTMLFGAVGQALAK